MNHEAALLDLSGSVQNEIATRALKAGIDTAKIADDIRAKNNALPAGERLSEKAIMYRAMQQATGQLRANTTYTLRPYEWESISNRIAEIASMTLVGVNDLRAAGLDTPLDAMANTVIGYDKVSDLTDAELTMKLGKRAGNDRLTYERVFVPLPFQSKFFEIDARELNMGRKLGRPLDTASAATGARKVAELAEQILFRGSSSYTAAGGVLYGYCDHPNRNTVAIGTQWTASDGVGTVVLGKVLDMIQASVDDNHGGPWMLYVPQGYAAVLGNDFKTYASTSIGQRLKEIQGIIDVKVAPKLTAHNVVLVEMSPDTVELVVGMDVTNIPWNTETGDLKQIIAACFIPLIKADADGRSGIVHMS